MLLPELEEDEEGDWGGDYEEAAHLVVMMVMKVMMLMTMMVIMVTIGDKHKQAANLVIIIAIMARTIVIMAMRNYI